MLGDWEARKTAGEVFTPDEVLTINSYIYKPLKVKLAKSGAVETGSEPETQAIGEAPTRNL